MFVLCKAICIDGVYNMDMGVIYLNILRGECKGEKNLVSLLRGTYTLNRQHENMQIFKGVSCGKVFINAGSKISLL